MRALLVLLVTAIVFSGKTPTYAVYSKGSSDGLDVDDPRVLQFMRTADEFFVFPVINPLKPRQSNKHLRSLDIAARRTLMRLLGEPHNWYHGAYTLLGVHPEPPNIGLLFRAGRSQLVLFFSRSFTSSAGLIEGSFNGRHVSGMLEDKPGKKMEKWSRRFAQPELSIPNKSN